MAVFLVILTILIAILLILLVLVQPGKADMGATFGGLGSQMGTMFGTERSKNILAQATKICAAAILVLVLVTNKFFIGNNNEAVNKIITEGQAATTHTAPQPKMPTGTAQPAQEQQQPAPEQGNK